MQFLAAKSRWTNLDDR